MSIRIIPRLDIKGPNLVKGIHMEGLRVLGTPEAFARYYYEQGADELIYMDAVASLYGRNSLLDIIGKAAREIFIPLTVGGGLRSVEDIKTVLRAGADKVSLNTAAIHNPALITEASRRFGSSTIVVSIEAIKKDDGTYEAYTDYGRESTGIDAVSWAVKAAELGAGEIMITSINNEGTGKGFDIDLISQITKKISIPVIAAGGAGTTDHIMDAIQLGKADAIGIASLLHYKTIQLVDTKQQAVSSEGNTEFLKRNSGFSKISGTTISEIKRCLKSSGIECRSLTPLSSLPTLRVHSPQGEG
jgi:cyclase